MKKFLSLAVMMIVCASTFAHAQDTTTPSQVPAAETAPIAQSEPTMQSDTAPASLDVAVEMREATLKDGTKISIEGENIFIVSDDGTKSLAPDGVHTMADGTTLTTKGGKLVAQ